MIAKTEQDAPLARTQSITLELDDETIRCLASLGEPIEVLVHLAHRAADNLRRPGQALRDQTDESLQAERDHADAALEKKREAIEDAADEVVRLARLRADQVVHTARQEADRERGPQPQAPDPDAGSESAERTRADVVVENERSEADAVLEHDRSNEKRRRSRFLRAERDATDNNLTGERAHGDTLIIDQREANERILSAAIRAQELTEEAEAAKERAEESERQLRAVAEFREMFIGILGHDLRNPLGSIVTAAALLVRRGRLEERDAETAARVIRASQRMGRMITQMLDLTRARLGGGLPIEARPTDLSEICQNVVEEFDATIQLDLEGDLTGSWDQDRLAQVLSNLVGNAVEYAAPGTVVILDARADGEEVVVEVRNQGAPIPEGVLPFIFEPFRRARQHEPSATGNLGLGLYIARQIVLSHGGTLDARSADGTTTFVMRLPRGRSAPPG